ncbi:MAG TPA: hypothetical protein PKU80_00150 [Candidatus Limiplasma sp.]|nr:hypothetical protein [Candidatus Limiplasma sp.]
MRKSVRVLILMLMLFTSLTAGTLAVYTSRIDLAPVKISAKRFALGVNQGNQDEFDLKIGPGELVSYQFVVSNQNADGNVSEVDMDLMINADFSEIHTALPDIEIKLLMDAGAGNQQVAVANASGQLNYEGILLFHASQAKEVSFSITFYWNDAQGSGTIPGNSSIVLPLTIYVKGVQHVSSAE